MLRSIVSNASFSLVSDVAARLSSALLLILIARQLGESAAGVLTLGNNYVLILSALALWGLDQLLIRDVAHDRSLSPHYFTHFFAIRLAITPVLWLLLAALLLGLHPYLPQTNRFIVLVGGTLIGNSISNLGQSLLIAFERVWLSALISIAVSALLLLTGVVILSHGSGMEGLALILVLTSWIQAALLTWVSRRYLRPKGFHFDGSFCRRQLVAGFPFVPINLFIALEGQLGAILLSFYYSEAVVGIYGMANVIISALALASQAIRVGVFPVMARLYRAEHEHFVGIYERSWRYLSIVSLPGAILLILLSEQIIRFIYPRTAPEAIVTLHWLAPTLFFYFVNIPNARLMILEGRQRMLARLYAISTAANLLVGFLLIPRYAAPAVAMARVASMSILFVLNCVYVERHVLAAHPWRFLWRPLAASAMMALVIFVILRDWPVFDRSLIGVALYVVLLVCLKAIPAEDWSWLRNRLALWTSRSIRRS
jgi:O-antigen/teichoic acid export membrane protein